MLIAQLSDLHLLSNQASKVGIDTSANARSLLEHVKKSNPDLVIITGDIADDGSPSAYAYISSLCEEFKLNTFVLPGNHDNYSHLRKYFPNNFQVEECFGSFVFGDYRIIFLDSSSNSISRQQLVWLNELEYAPSILCIHHPPTKMSSFYMDKFHPLKNHEILWKSLVTRGDIKHVICGHYHHGSSLKRDDIEVHLCPSGFMQYPHKWYQLKTDYRIGYRILEFKNEHVDTRVEYLDTQLENKLTFKYLIKKLIN